MCTAEQPDRKSQENESQRPSKHLTFPWEDLVKKPTKEFRIFKKLFDKCEEQRILIENKLDQTEAVRTLPWPFPRGWEDCTVVKA